MSWAYWAPKSTTRTGFFIPESYLGHDGWVNTYIGFLRGINLGPARRVAMADLRARLADVDRAALEPERFAIGPGRTEIYLWYANGMARSKLAAMVLPDRRLGVSPTVRNWNTVTKLLELSGG